MTKNNNAFKFPLTERELFQIAIDNGYIVTGLSVEEMDLEREHFYCCWLLPCTENPFNG